MEFDIRAISLVESVAADARVDIRDLLGKEIEFREGLRYSIILPNTQQQFARLIEPEKTLTALSGWARLYRHPDGRSEKLHIIAPAENDEGDLVFYRIDLGQPPKPRRGPRSAAELVGSAVMTYDECATWLIELSHTWALNPGQKMAQFVMSRPSRIPPQRIRLAWVGPEIVGDRHMQSRLISIGNVHGAEIVHVIPRTYREVRARLAGSLPLDAVVVSRQFVPQITVDAVPERVRPNLVHFCDSAEPEDLEQQLRTWIEIAHEEIQDERKGRTTDQGDMLLAIMLRLMLSHSKIGPVNHCPKETVLKGVRARRLNVPTAERILDENSEAHQDTKESDAIFLWKDHNDGRQYFLNSRRIEHIKTLVLTNGR